jgi:hypothetical protein
LQLGVGRDAARVRLLMRSSTCGTSQPRRRGGGGFHHRVLLGYEQEEEDDDDADKRARGGSDTERREGQGSRGEAVCGFGWAGPIHDA